MTFNTEKFIREIGNRKAIWDRTSEEYSDRDVRRRRWEEITNIMCEENLTENEKNEFGKSLQQKWKNIRTSFTRELKRRTKSGSAASRKSPYVYFDQLQFLRKTVVNNSTQSSMDETSTVDNSDESGRIQTRSPVSKKKKKKTEDESLVEILKESIAVREERERKQESDADRLFIAFASTRFQKYSKNRRLSTKMELIDVIKRSQIHPNEAHHPEFGTFRPEPGTSTSRSYSRRPKKNNNYYEPGISISGQFHRRYSTQPNHEKEGSNSGKDSHGYSSSSPVDTTYIEVLSPTNTNVSDSQNSEICT